jgi:hypothetical protein
MKHSKPAMAVILLTLAVLLLTPADIFSCGPFFSEAVFVSTRRPAASINDYLAGHLGVVQPSYYDVYLAIAYRVLSGKPISAEEVAKAKMYWGYDQYVNKIDEEEMKAWYAARAAALGGRPPSGNTEPQPSSYDAYKQNEVTFTSYMNCTPDAFQNAALTVKSRTQRFGAGTPVMHDWVEAQNAVFSNCTQPETVPSAAPANADSLIKADRAYQIAAAHFYREQFDDARAEFLQIAKDHDSPWSMIAPYLAARSLIRQATINAPEDKPPDPKLLAQAETELRAILADKNAAAIHPAVLRTLGFVEFRLSPEQRMHTLALEISGEQPTADLGQALIDYTRLLEQKANDKPAADEMTDWILTAKSGDLAKAREHALARWQQTHAMPWLIAALLKSKAQDTQVDALLKAAAAVPDDSPAHASASFQRARLLIGQQKLDDARHLLDRELQRVPAPPNETRNLYLGLRWRLAQNFDEFLQFAPQVPVDYTYGDDEMGYCIDDNCSSGPNNSEVKPVPLFNVPVASTLNQGTPLQLLSDATRSNLLPQNLRQTLLLSTWTRAAFLGNPSQAAALGKQLAQTVPETAPYMNAYAAANDADSRQFAAVFVVLHFPGMRPYVNAGVLRTTPLAKIDDFRDNWWCEDVGGRIGVPNFDNELYSGNYTQQTSAGAANTSANGASSTPPKNPEPPSPGFFSSDQRTQANDEWTRLSQIGTAPNYFGKVVLGWAKAHPDDARVPEALHLVVRSTRYGCTNRDTAKLSKQAFDRLHNQYPKSQWAKQTPFWFN